MVTITVTVKITVTIMVKVATTVTITVPFLLSYSNLRLRIFCSCSSKKSDVQISGIVVPNNISSEEEPRSHYTYISPTTLTSMCAPERLALSKQQFDRLALARSVFLKFAILKLIKRKSNFERSAESKLIP